MRDIDEVRNFTQEFGLKIPESWIYLHVDKRTII